LKWSELTYSNFYIPYDENQKAIRGFLLTTLGINLEEIPFIFNEPFNYYEGNEAHKDKLYVHKVFLNEIVGTSYADYGGMEIIQSYLRIKRADSYIKDGLITPNKYFYMLKKSVNEQDAPIILSRLDNGKYFVDGNGNHRIVLYKIMMLAEIAYNYSYAYDEDYDFSYWPFDDIGKKYWLNAKVRIIK